MVTAEYAACGVASTGFAALLYNFLMSPKVQDTVADVVGFVLSLRG